MKHAREELITSLRSGRMASDRILSIMNTVPRHLFVSEALRYRAYTDISLPIGFGQTISKPSIIARMVQALELKGSERVLEIGTGSGYQTAVLARAASSVVSMERIEELCKRAKARLFNMKLMNVKFYHTDNFNDVDGMFDSIIVAAGADVLPRDIFDKLNDGGILVIPVTGRSGHDIKKFYKVNDTCIDSDCLGEATFVPYITG